MAILPPDPVFVFRGDMGSVHSVLFNLSLDKPTLFAGTLSGRVHAWDLKTNREIYQIQSGDDTCLTLQSKDKNKLLVQQKCGLINLFKATESDWILENSFNTDFCHYCRFQVHSESEAFVPLKDSTVGVLSIKTFKVEARLEALKVQSNKKLGDVMFIKPLGNGSNLVLVGYEAGELFLWDYKERKVLSQLAIESEPMAMDFDYSLMRGIIGGPSDQLQVFNLSHSHVLSDKAKLMLRNSGTSVVTVRPDSKIVSIGGWDSRVRIFSWKNLRPLAVLDIHKDTIHDVIFSEGKVDVYNNKYLMATAGKDGYVALWDIY